MNEGFLNGFVEGAISISYQYKDRKAMNTQAFSLEGLVWGLGFGRLDLSVKASRDVCNCISQPRQIHALLRRETERGLGCRGKGL